MNPVKLYTLPALAKVVGINYRTLRSWASLGWLEGYAPSGNRWYYTMEGFEAAAAKAKASARASAKESAQPTMTTMEQDAKIYDEIVKKHSTAQGLQRPGRIRERITSTRKRGAL